jgi:hypothetical protein
MAHWSSSTVPLRDRSSRPLHWNAMPNGEAISGGAFVMPRDLLKVGQAVFGRRGLAWKAHRRGVVGRDLDSTAHVRIGGDDGTVRGRLCKRLQRWRRLVCWHLHQLHVGNRTLRD